MKYFVGDILLLPGQGEAELRREISLRLRIPSNSFHFEWVKRRALLEKGALRISYDCSVDTFSFIRNTQIHFYEETPPFRFPTFSGKGPICVVGGGLSGLFCAYLLSKAGAPVYLLEKGDDPAGRKAAREEFQQKQIFQEASNSVTGFGGYSSVFGGYLEQEFKTSQSQYVLSELVTLGLPKTLEKEGFAFVSCDQVAAICNQMSSFILSHGGKIFGRAEATSIERFLGWPKGVSYLQNGSKHFLKANQIVIAGGNGPAGLSFAGSSHIALKPATPSLGLFVEVNGRDFEGLYYGRGRATYTPPFFCEDSFENAEGRKLSLRVGYCNAAMRNASPIPFRVDLSPQINAWSGAGNAIASVSVSLNAEEVNAISNADGLGWGDRLFSGTFSRLSPYAIPSEMLGDFLARKEPMLLGSVRSSYDNGVYLSNLHRFLPRPLSSALLSGVFELTRRYPAFASSRALVSGFSTMGTSRYLPLPLASGSRGIYSLLPRAEEGEDLLKAALRAFEVAVRVLSEA